MRQGSNERPVRGTGVVIFFASLAIFGFITLDLDLLEMKGLKVISYIHDSFGSPTMDYLAKVASLLGYELFFVLFPFLLWICDAKKDNRVGRNLIKLQLMVFYIMSVIKVIYQRSRPIHMADVGRHEDDLHIREYSFPSGHAFGSTTSFFYLADCYAPGSYFATAAALTLMALCAASRVYLGVHYPHDVIAGICIGAILTILRRGLGLLKVEDGERLRHTFLGLFVVSILSAIPYVFPEQDRIDQRGFQVSIGGLMALHLSEVFGGANQHYPTTPVAMEQTGFGKSLLKLLVGLPGMVFLVAHKLHPAINNEYGKLLTNAVLNFWMCDVAPMLFAKFGLRRAKTLHEDKKGGKKTQQQQQQRSKKYD